MVVTAEDKEIDEKRLEYFIGYKDLKMESPESVKKLTKCQLKHLPPLGSV